MTRNKGRPNKYFTHIEPNLDKIEEMALTMSEKQIAKSLGIGITTWKKHKKQYPSISDRLKKGRTDLVQQLKSVLIKKAIGFNYEEKKVVKITKEDGEEIREETMTKASLPDVAAINLLLKNYDKENWANDPQTLELHKKELELRKKQIEQNLW